MGPVVRKHCAAASALWSDWRESLKPRALRCSGVLRHLRSWALFSINGRDLPPRVETSAAAGISVLSQELRPLQWRSSGLRNNTVNATSRCDTRGSPWVLISVTQNQGGAPQKMSSYVPTSECPLCVWASSLSHTSWWRTCWGKEVVAITRLSAAAWGWDFTGLCIYIKKHKFHYMPCAIHALQEGQCPC